MSALPQRPFGRTGVRVSALGLGTWAMGGDEWGPTDDRQSSEVLRAAVEAGVTLIDTADVYGLGHSEELIGEAVPDGAGVVIVTKVGWDIYTDPPVVGGARRRYDRAYLERAAAESARRLRRQTLDVLLLHNPTRADLNDGEAVGTLSSLRDTGLVRFVGASVGAEDDARAALEAGIDVLEVPFNLVRRWAAGILPAAARLGVAVIAREPFERGLLTGKYGPDAVFPAGDHRSGKGSDWLASAQPHVARLRTVAAARGVDPAAVALAWPLTHRDVSTVIAGARSADQVSANASATRLELSEMELQLLEGPSS